MAGAARYFEAFALPTGQRLLSTRLCDLATLEFNHRDAAPSS